LSLPFEPEDMRILIAEDDPLSRTVLVRMLQKWGHEVVVTHDGRSAWEGLQGEEAPKLAILDWMMPEMDGLEVCRRVRELDAAEPTYLILLTAKDQIGDIVEGLDSGANDYLIKPYDWRELQSRLRVGERMVSLQQDLAQRVRELQYAMSKIHELQELIPICSYCKKVRDDGNYWQQVESYLATRAGVHFSHGVCPECYARVVAELEKSIPGTPETSAVPAGKELPS
jgi:sigma-B regulation protein RsbU (phosphoserine phosphatase)